jgi:MFS family permease
MIGTNAQWVASQSGLPPGLASILSEEDRMTAEVIAPETLKKVAAAALIATTIEWYDFFIYGTAAALVFPTVFFSSSLTPLIALLVAFSTFAVGFIARPIGAIIFGHFGDRIGRKKALVIALVLMAMATTLIGLLPSYKTIGVLAPLALVMLRCLQGLALGGQWGGAMLLITEIAPKHRRGFYGAFAQAGGGTGTILANLVFLSVSASLPQEAFMSWGWRVPFLMSIVLIPVAMYIQLRLEDTPSFKRLQKFKAQRDAGLLKAISSGTVLAKEHARPELADERRSSPIVEALSTYPREIALAAGTIVGIQVTFYVLNVFAVAYASSPAGLNLSRNLMLSGVLAGAVTLLAGIFIAGAASDRYGRRPMLLIGGALLGIWAFFIFPLIKTGSLLWIMVAIGVGQLFMGFVSGPQAAFFAELFSAKVRYSGASLAYQGGAILGGGLAPMIATTLYARFGSTLAVSIYVACTCLVTVASAFFAKESYQRDLD